MISLLVAAEVFIPDGDDARRQAEEELSKQIYQAAKPNWLDRLAADFIEWFFGLFTGDANATVAPFATTALVIIVVAALVVALILWGKPRASRAIRRSRDLLGERDDRTAAQLRAEASSRAKGDDWNAAVVLRFRALARGLIERDLIDPAPGATAQGIARTSAMPFPGFADRLTQAATLFDGVRYLGVTADEHDYRTISAIDDDLQSAAPLISSPEAVPA